MSEIEFVSESWLMSGRNSSNGEQGRGRISCMGAKALLIEKRLKVLQKYILKFKNIYILKKKKKKKNPSKMYAF